MKNWHILIAVFVALILATVAAYFSGGLAAAPFLFFAGWLIGRLG